MPALTSLSRRVRPAARPPRLRRPLPAPLPAPHPLAGILGGIERCGSLLASAARDHVELSPADAGVLADTLRSVYAAVRALRLST